MKQLRVITCNHFKYIPTCKSIRCVFGFHKKRIIGFFRVGNTNHYSIPTGHTVEQCQNCLLVFLTDRGGAPRVSLGYYPKIEPVEGETLELTVAVDSVQLE